MSVLIAIGCMIVFAAGIACYPLAFQMDNDTLSLLVFISGVLLNSLAFFIPWQLVGRSRK
ncbi:hypothetical protein [Gulosibacter molinativorax]|uniref:Uncharacterized protein n=1 Tax=Gulosibacter molinativorax TaxID=256821 RepID=A0ABT7C4L0_9MICO|nr:hypothetical protein [Gulosibacter molinativorax]MDJ1370147.1 hypothetical protein [Gulosibacter molinativorax]QUY61558.1 Hypotetical protein [Gulosibacter molinativorax]